jgi:hypothetical protein
MYQVMIIQKVGLTQKVPWKNFLFTLLKQTDEFKEEAPLYLPPRF